MTMNYIDPNVVGNNAEAAVQDTSVAAIQARLRGILTSIGDPSGNNLVSIVDKFGNSTESLLTTIGITVDAAVQSVIAASVQARLAGLLTSIGDPSGDILVDLVSKWGNIARSLTAELGSRWNVSGDLGTDIAALLAVRDIPRPSLIEDWLDGIDALIWTLTNPATGAAWALTDNNGIATLQSIPNASEFARIVSTRRWISTLGAGTNHILRKFIVEWEMTGANFANVDDTKFLVGLSTGLADDKSTPNVVGFSIDNTQTLTAYSSNGANTQETVLAVGAPNTFQKFRLELYGGGGGAPIVDYYVNEVLVASHDGSGAPFAVPSGMFYHQVYFPTGVGGAATVIIGTRRCWYENITT